MALEPGPFAVRDVMPLPPRVFTPGRVLSLAADAQAAHAGIEQGLASTSHALAVESSSGLEVPDQGAVITSYLVAGGVAPGGDNDALARAVDSGYAIDGDGALQQTSLPGPDEDEPPTDLERDIEHEPGPPPEGEPEPVPLP